MKRLEPKVKDSPENRAMQDEIRGRARMSMAIMGGTYQFTHPESRILYYLNPAIYDPRSVSIGN